MNEKYLTDEFFTKLPKTDLHCHLDGSLRIETLIDLAKKHKVELPTYNVNEIKEALHLGKIHENLVNYLKVFDLTCAVMKNIEDIKRVTYELVEDCAKENVWHLEIRFCPTLLINNNLSINEITNAALIAMNQASEEFSISAKMIICGLKHYSLEQNLELAQLALDFSTQGVVAYDLAGPEDGFENKNYQQICLKALRGLINVTIHAGEAFGPASISQALFYCGANRIGHGVRLIENEKLTNYVLDRRIPLELCPTSNLQTGVVDDLKNHPFKKLFDLGIKTTLNTDNRLVSDTTITKEYQVLYKHLGFSQSELIKVALNGFESAFLPYQVKQKMITKFKKHMFE
jgi:adenosine deaminase